MLYTRMVYPIGFRSREGGFILGGIRKADGNNLAYSAGANGKYKNGDSGVKLFDFWMAYYWCSGG